MLNLLATATPEQVFKSVGDTLDQRSDPTVFIMIAAGVVALIVLVALLNRRSAPKSTRTKVVHNSTKLTRQIARQVGLKPREMRQLKQLAEQEGIENPLVLLICPSVLQAAMKRKQWTQK